MNDLLVPLPRVSLVGVGLATNYIKIKNNILIM